MSALRWLHGDGDGDGDGEGAASGVRGVWTATCRGMHWLVDTPFAAATVLPIAPLHSQAGAPPAFRHAYI